MWAVVPTNIWRKTPTSQTLPSQTSPAHPFLSDLLDNIDECRQESALALKDLWSAWGKIRQAPKTWWAAPTTNLPHERPSLPPACVHETCLTRRLPGWRIGCLSLCAWRHACARLGSCFGASGNQLKNAIYIIDDTDLLELMLKYQKYWYIRYIRIIVMDYQNACARPISSLDNRLKPP